MKTTRLNSALFGNMELKNADMKNFKGGQLQIIDHCDTGCGPSGFGGMACDSCVVYSDGSSLIFYTKLL